MRVNRKNKNEVVTIRLKKSGDGPQKVLLKDLGYGEFSDCCGTEFGYKTSYDMTCSNWDAFFGIMELESLEMFLKSAIEHENYEIVETIKKHIDRKRKK